LLLAGAEKHWIIVPRSSADKLESCIREQYSASKSCLQFLRHHNVIVGPRWLEARGIRYEIVGQKPGDLLVTLPGRVYHEVRNIGGNFAMCHGLRLSCLMGNRVSPSVRCDYPSHTSAVYSRTCISTARSYTQYNLSSILQFLPAYALFTHRNSYEPGCTGLFSPATVAFVPLHLSCTLLHRVHPRRICCCNVTLLKRRTLLYRVHHKALLPRPPQRTRPPRPPQRICHPVHHNALLPRSPTTHLQWLLSLALL
jgi:hypothetical protein